MIRKFFNSSITELVDIYDSATNNISALRELENELKYRTKHKSKNLLINVEKSIAELLSDNDNDSREIPNNNVVLQEEKLNEGILKAEKNKTNNIENTNSAPRNSNNSQATKNKIEIPFDYKNFRGIGDLSDVPQKREFNLSNDLKLDFNETDITIKKFRVALEALIKEIRNQNGGTQKFQVYNGKPISLPETINGYSFSFDGEIDIFEGLNITTLIANERIEGKVYAIYEKKVLLSFSKPLPMVGLKLCTITIDKAAFIEILKDRYIDIENNNSKIQFNRGLANDMLDNLSQENSIDNSHVPFISGFTLNQNQINAVLKGLSNKVTYMWGPPGTGKTETITALIDRYYSLGKRVLLISNTNQAVDQVLLKMCDKISKLPEGESVLNSGKFIRMGKIKKEELDTKYGEFLNLDSIVEKKSKELLVQKQELTAVLNSILEDISINQSIVKAYELAEGLQRKKTIFENLLIKLSDELDLLNTTLKHQISKISDLEQELLKSINAGAIKSIFLRNEKTINLEIESMNELIIATENRILFINIELESNKNKEIELVNELTTLSNQIIDISKNEVEKRLIQLENRETEFKKNISEIEKKLKEVKEHILQESSLVGATITRVFISPNLFANFDCIIADEASMILLPALYYVAGLVKESIFISGDSRQLSPIVQTNQRAIFDLIGHDILTRIIEEKGMSKRVVKLEVQYRMCNDICSLVSINYPILKTGRDIPIFTCKSEELNHSLIIINTSELYPYVNRDKFNSRYNIINIVVGNAIANTLASYGEKNIGFCTPYTAQGKILDRTLNQEKFVSGTIHKYQGDDKDTMIIDIPDSYGEWGVGMFLEGSIFESNKSNSLDSGTKLFNVGISRAKNRLIIIGNLHYLDKKLPPKAYLRKVLHTMVNQGSVIDARGLFDIKKYDEELSLTVASRVIDKLEVGTGIYNENSFMEDVLLDIHNAQKSILIYSGFITNERVSSYEAIFKRKLLEGVKIKCVTRPPNANGSIKLEETSIALDSLENIGCIVETRAKIHEKMVAIDDKIVWLGSLNPLSYNGKTNELMMRIEDVKLVRQLQLFLSVLKQREDEFDSMLNENPKCPKCNSRTTYAVSKFGPFWGCEKCNWIKSVNNIKHN